MAENHIKIISGWSNPGGSTVAHINLCNLFNDNGFTCTYYGPHDWHLDKCRSSSLDAGLSFDPDDIVITHFIRPSGVMKGNCKKSVLSCHETNMYPLKQFAKEGKLKFSNYDFIHFVSDSQRLWHRAFHPYEVIPNVISELKEAPKDLDTVGIIGSIDPHKQTHLSISRALKDGHTKIKLFGEVTNPDYFHHRVKPLMKEGITLEGHVDDKQKMYDQVGTVYHSSLRETFNYIQAECLATGVKYKGLKSAESGAKYMTNTEILDRWVEALEL